MKQLPPDVTLYKQTPTFSEDSIPKGLLRAHQTKSGTWGKIVLLEGRLRYRILEPELEEVELSVAIAGIVEPEVRHEVEPIGDVLFFVEFHR